MRTAGFARSGNMLQPLLTKPLGLRAKSKAMAFGDQRETPAVRSLLDSHRCIQQDGAMRFAVFLLVAHQFLALEFHPTVQFLAVQDTACFFQPTAENAWDV